MTHEELVDEVLAKLNEIGYSDDMQLITDNGLTLEDYIEIAIKDAVVQLDRVNPKRVFLVYNEPDSGLIEPGKLVVGADGTVELGEDFVSLIEVEGDGWNRPVSMVTERGTPEYVMAMNEYTAPKANSPMVTRKGKRGLRLMPATGGVMVYNAAYGGTGITGEAESRLVVDAAAQIVYKIFADGNR